MLFWSRRLWSPGRCESGAVLRRHERASPPELRLAHPRRLAIFRPPRGSGLRPRLDADGREARMSGCTHTATWRRILGLLGLIALAQPGCVTEPRTPVVKEAARPHAEEI